MQALQSICSIEKFEMVKSYRQEYQQNFDPFTLADEEFHRQYRFTKQTAKTIVDLLREDLVLGRSCAITAELQVLTAIRYWDSEDNEAASNIHGLSQATVSTICDRVACALARHASHYIKMPVLAVEQEQIMHEFEKISRLTSVIGCIDCTVIKIKIQDVSNYLTLNVQVTCDASLSIRDIVARWDDDDAQLFNESALKLHLEKGEFRGKLLGDTKYRFEHNVLTPILSPQSKAEEKYNQAHYATKATVAQCIYVWKQRFRSLLHSVLVPYGNAKRTIIALAVLHNIAIESKDTSILQGSNIKSMPEYTLDIDPGGTEDE